jgi:Chaperone of endosialidase
MKHLSLFLLLVPCLAWAQYPTNGNQKITLGEQTSADGLIYRGVLADTGMITPLSDTSAYIILDTVNNRFYNYNRATNVWSVTTIGSISSGLTGVLPVANGGTNRTTMPSGYILHGDGTSIDTAIGLFWDRTNSRLGIGTIAPIYKLDVQGSSNTVSMRMASNTANDILLYFTGNITGDINMFQSAFDATGNVQAQFYNQNTSTGSALLNIQVPNTSSGDPYLQFTTSGSLNYSFGIDNSDSDKFKFHSAPTPSNSKIAAYTITSNDEIGIGIESPTEKLHVVGNVKISTLAATGTRSVLADVNGVLSAPVSSINYKENVQLINYGLNEILQINPVSFDYIDKGKWGDDRNLGFIVEDIFPIIPEVTGTLENDVMYLDMTKLIPILTKAIQEQQVQIEALKQRLLILENK